MYSGDRISAHFTLPGLWVVAIVRAAAIAYFPNSYKLIERHRFATTAVVGLWPNFPSLQFYFVKDTNVAEVMLCVGRKYL